MDIGYLRQVTHIYILIGFAAGTAYMVFIVNIALLFLGIENSAVYHRVTSGKRDTIFGPFARLVSGGFFRSKASVSMYGAFFSLAAVYYFLPVGSLPSFIELRGGFLIVLLLLILSQTFYLIVLRGYSRKLYRSIEKSQINVMLRFTFALLAAYSTFGWFALNVGMPGDILSFSTYSAVPLYKVTDIWGRAGLLLFFISIAAVSPFKGPRRGEAGNTNNILEAFDAVRTMLGPAALVSLFLNCGAAAFCPFTGWKMFAADFTAYWVLVFIVQIFAVPCVHSLYTRLQRYSPVSLRPLLFLVFSAAGAACMMADLYL